MARNDWLQLLNTDPRGISQDGLTLSNFTTSAAVFPAIVLPANFLARRVVHLRARGEWGCTTGSPTFTFRLQGTAGTVVTWVTGPAISCGASAVSNQKWEADIQIQARTEGTTGTILAAGDIDWLSATAGVTTKVTMPAVGTANATATLDTTIAQTFQLEVACSLANAANTIKGTILEVKSLN